MKNSRNERLSEHLLNVDDEIVANAYEIDDAEKLRRYCKKKNAKTKKPLYMTPAFRRAATIAACFVLIVGVMLSITSMLNQEGNDVAPGGSDVVPGGSDVFPGGSDVVPGVGDVVPGGSDVGQGNHQGETVPPSLKGEEDYRMINSIAKLSYYAAIRMIEGQPKTIGLSKSRVANASYEIDTLSGVNDENNKEDEVTEPDTSEDNVTAPSDPTPPDPFENILHYSLDPDEPFYINRVSMFQIELTDENGFLASELGLGIVDVVIAEKCIWGDSLITFRQGDNFYSCLTNGSGYDLQTGERCWNFSTHKYIDGFFIVKNLAQENYRFDVKTDAQGQVFEFNCSVFKNGGGHVDTNVRVVSSTVISEEGRSFTVAELENYFNTEKTPDENGNEEIVLPPKADDADTNQAEIAE